MAASSFFATLWNRWIAPVGLWLRTRPRGQIALTCYLSVALIALLDYEVGLAISLTPLYGAPIAVMAWFIGAGPAFVMAVITLVLWIAGDRLAGQHYFNVLTPAINFSLRMIFYAFYTVALARLSQLQLSLEELAAKRALLLSQEMAERERLENEVLDIAEREQRRIGQDLHDSLCQHLTGTALTSQALAERLEDGKGAEAQQARRVVDLVEDAIVLARGIAKGLYPVEAQPGGLMQALEEFSVTASGLFGIQCRFECHSPVLVHSPSAAVQLYRIAQEAVSNAVKHGRATEILILLEETDKELRLVISDNGAGLSAVRKEGGMGLRIMADRARIVGGSFSLRPAARAGTELVCLVPPGGLNAA